MNYNLAKKLKDAGFPKKLFRLGRNSADFANGVDRLLWLNQPTLSELIAACEIYFWSLKRTENPKLVNIGKRWLAETELLHEYGSTPEEAVANLWLSLQETKAPDNTQHTSRTD